jgi:hypothetical protein
VDFVGTADTLQYTENSTIPNAYRTSGERVGRAVVAEQKGEKELYSVKDS